jgi:hypothetical protein
VDEKEMIRRFVRALAEDPDFRQSIGIEAAGYVRRECSIAGCASRYAEFIASVSAPARST